MGRCDKHRKFAAAEGGGELRREDLFRPSILNPQGSHEIRDFMGRTGKSTPSFGRATFWPSWSKTDRKRNRPPWVPSQMGRCDKHRKFAAAEGGGELRREDLFRPSILNPQGSHEIRDFMGRTGKSTPSFGRATFWPSWSKKRRGAGWKSAEAGAEQDRSGDKAPERFCGIGRLRFFIP